MKVTREQVENFVVSEQYHHFPGTNVTIACLKGKNGFDAVGISGCADPAEFIPEFGRKAARDDAIKNLWGHMGFELCTLLKEQADGN